MNLNEEYRIVEKYSGFFSHTYYTLEKKITWWFFGTRSDWEKVAGNSLLTYVPDSWRKYNIVDEISFKY